MSALKIVLTMLLLPVLGVSEDLSELYTCSFTAHTPVGDLSGRCTTQSLPDAAVIARWAFTLTFDTQTMALAGNLQPDAFYDMVRGQCLQDGSFTNVMPLWGDFVIKPDSPDYIAGLLSCTPIYQVAPNRITLTRISANPLVMQFLFEERPEDLDPKLEGPSQHWIIQYLDSFRRLKRNSR